MLAASLVSALSASSRAHQTVVTELTNRKNRKDKDAGLEDVVPSELDEVWASGEQHFLERIDERYFYRS